jgi:hypothetical protein
VFVTIALRTGRLDEPRRGYKPSTLNKLAVLQASRVFKGESITTDAPADLPTGSPDVSGPAESIEVVDVDSDDGSGAGASAGP